ncbi:MAG TPA: hypothetical protein VFA20_29770 [Myxococcaceae bacterium]|nr:hypothetical protein [Myxococcaceae bacterium]
MSLLALARPGVEAYAIEFAAALSPVLARLPAEDVAEIRRRLGQIAEVAGHAGGIGFMVLEGLGIALRLEIGSYVVSYSVNDSKRTLTVVSVVSLESR